MSRPNTLDLTHEAIDAFIEEARNHLHNYYKTGKGKCEMLCEAFDEWLEDQETEEERIENEE